MWIIVIITIIILHPPPMKSRQRKQARVVAATAAAVNHTQPAKAPAHTPRQQEANEGKPPPPPYPPQHPANSPRQHEGKASPPPPTHSILRYPPTARGKGKPYISHLTHLRANPTSHTPHTSQGKPYISAAPTGSVTDWQRYSHMPYRYSQATSQAPSYKMVPYALSLQPYALLLQPRHKLHFMAGGPILRE